jgi:hypothetical protein
VRNPRCGKRIFISGRQQSGGKVHQFDVYLERDLFDTPENRVITSGLTWLCLQSVLDIQTFMPGAADLANIGDTA